MSDVNQGIKTDRMKDSQKSHTEPLKVPFDDAWRFIIKVGTAAHRWFHRNPAGVVPRGPVERLGYRGVFRSTPSDIVFALREGPESPQRVEVIATPAPGVDLGQAGPGRRTC